MVDARYFLATASTKAEHYRVEAVGYRPQVLVLVLTLGS